MFTVTRVDCPVPKPGERLCTRHKHTEAVPEPRMVIKLPPDVMVPDRGTIDLIDGAAYVTRKTELLMLPFNTNNETPEPAIKELSQTHDFGTSLGQKGRKNARLVRSHQTEQRPKSARPQRTDGLKQQRIYRAYPKMKHL
jgi:hypothetical protein